MRPAVLLLLLAVACAQHAAARRVPAGPTAKMAAGVTRAVVDGAGRTDLWWDEPLVAASFEVAFDEGWVFLDHDARFVRRDEQSPGRWLELIGTCTSDGTAAYRRLDRLTRGHRRWHVEVSYTTDCAASSIAFVIATNRAGRKRYLGFGLLPLAGRRSIPFELDVTRDERVGVAFGLQGSGISCGETVIRHIEVVPDDE